MSELKVNKISPRSGTDVTLGDSGDTFTLGSGANIAGLTLSDNILFDTASKGIYLGVTSATASNLLNDYEFGTWTPSVSSTSGSFTTVGTVAGYYTKIGNIVHFQAEISITTNGTASGNINVDGLPFTSANPGIVHTVNMAREAQINGATFTTIISSNVTQLVMLSPPFGNGAGYSLNGVYRV
jgi:hypothetical protein